MNAGCGNVRATTVYENFMKIRPQILLASLFTCLAACAVVHTPPGTSVEVALAKRPDVVRLPATPTPKPVLMVAAKMPAGGAATAPQQSEQVADAFSRGDFCMKAGKDAEAIVAFREAVKADPNFTDAWTNLAILYEKQGQEKLAMEAFRKSKKNADRTPRAM